MSVPVIGLGGGGHAKCVIEILRSNGEFELVGLLDSNPDLKGQEVLGLAILGGDELLTNLLRQGIRHFFLGLGGAADNQPRRNLYEHALSHGLQPVKAIHTRAIISNSALIGPGAVVMAGAVINAAGRIGANVIINTGAIVEHDCIVSDHVHVATGARLASTVRVGEMVHIGAGATIRQCISIGEGAIIGAGAVVVHDVPPNVTVVGVPARELRKA